MALAGLIVIVAADAALGAMLIGVATLVVLANAFIRLGMSSDRDRAREQRARRTFMRTGRWPHSPPCSER
ncbi:MAG TPA: hypothetical protein VHF51_08295 [Solirubrobacteraceae bacterium]|nr:hypothetical protein [Solirubrobacteraceae bacterium]